jgi:uncharacterized protein (TIGR03000 family)
MRTRLMLLAVSVLFVPATAHAQFFFPGFYGYGGYGGIFGSNPYTFGGRFYGYPGGYGYPNYGMSGSPYGAFPSTYSGLGGYYGGGGPSYGMPSFSSSRVQGTSSQYLLPGWMASTTTYPRSRPTLGPAVEIAANDAKPAVYSSDGPGSVATVEVKVPANAELWFEGVKQNKTGAVREFKSPPLDPKYKYSYDVKVRWTNDAGSQQEQTRTVNVRAGERTVVDFTTKK